jgi:hypothetical protein
MRLLHRPLSWLLGRLFKRCNRTFDIFDLDSLRRIVQYAV